MLCNCVQPQTCWNFSEKKKKSEGPEADIWNEKLQLG